MLKREQWSKDNINQSLIARARLVMPYLLEKEATETRSESGWKKQGRLRSKLMMKQDQAERNEGGREFWKPIEFVERKQEADK